MKTIITEQRGDFIYWHHRKNFRIFISLYGPKFVHIEHWYSPKMIVRSGGADTICDVKGEWLGVASLSINEFEVAIKSLVDISYLDDYLERKHNLGN